MVSFHQTMLHYKHSMIKWNQRQSVVRVKNWVMVRWMTQLALFLGVCRITCSKDSLTCDICLNSYFLGLTMAFNDASYHIILIYSISNSIVYRFKWNIVFAFDDIFHGTVQWALRNGQLTVFCDSEVLNILVFQLTLWPLIVLISVSISLKSIFAILQIEI